MLILKILCQGLLHIGTCVKSVSYTHLTVLQLLRHASGLPDYRRAAEFSPDTPWTFDALLQLAARNPLHFVPGTEVEQSATNFLLLTEIVERVSGLSYHDFVTKRQIEFLGLGHTGFKEDLGPVSYTHLSANPLSGSRTQTPG